VPTERGPIVICDAGPLIHLDELHCLDFLTEYPAVLVPDIVWGEVLRHRPSALRRRGVRLTRVDRVPEPAPELVNLIESLPLDAGEEHALRLMQEHPGALLLTDDRAARSAAHQLGFEAHGTLGVLLFGWRRGRRSKRQTLNLLRAIPQRSSLHIDKKLLEGIISELRENAR
jgi:predicted nucleic acid-binding protein